MVVIGTLDRFSQLTGLGLAAISLLWYYVWARHHTTISGELGDWLQREHPIRSALSRTEASGLDQRPTILVPVDGVETGRRLVSLATALAQGQRGITVTVLKVVPIPYNLALVAGQQQIQRVARHQHALNQMVLDQTLDNIERGDVEIRTQVQGARNVASAIVEIATHQANPNLVLLGWHGPLTLKRIRTSIDTTVLNQVSSRVAVLQDKGLERVQRVLVAIADNRHAPWSCSWRTLSSGG